MKKPSLKEIADFIFEIVMLLIFLAAIFGVIKL